MTCFVHFEIPGDPQAWKRARNHGKRFFEDPAQKSTKLAIQYIARKAGVKLIEAGPIRVDVVFDSAVKDAKLHGKYRPCRPDLDNFVKLIFDALNGVAWKDDGQIAVINARDFYAARSRTVVTISALPDRPGPGD